MSTPATAALTAAGVPFTTHAYKHDPANRRFGAEAAGLLELDPQRVFKTLVVDADGRLVVAILPVSEKLDLGALAAAVGSKRATLADPAVAERKTGYVVGGISPFGQKSRLVTVVDESALSFDTVFVSGGTRGLDLELAPRDLIAAAPAQTAAIAWKRP